ncbi:hypothetical protein [Actinomycetospora sp. NBRC 106378]|uniref:hypothetical protein n=1 Tax=Actinomycetospora sp. NBRC 106378 TaxID=3032208 RepID=UPI0024A067F0|nr:hypothetical protein [Actinomycetospora sp. NBRC 106378]GLZ53405.1 hypothetical protein Acsp07_30220 [Actinomycetospora sp. NBRC 106378]
MSFCAARRRWRRRVGEAARALVTHQQPAGTSPPCELAAVSSHVPALGLIAAYRVRGGAGDAVVEWLDRHLAARGHRLVPAAALPDATAHPEARSGIVLVQPLDGRDPPQPIAWPAAVGPGCVVGLVGYGPRRSHSRGLGDRDEQIAARGARTAREVVLLDVDALRTEGVPTPFERIALDTLLDSLIPPAQENRSPRT